MQKYDFLFILKLFFAWSILLVIIIYFSPKLFTLQPDFLGGRITNYLTNPFLWSRANFDGKYYLTIAQKGYEPFTYFFFPFYPIMIRFLSLFIGKSLFIYLISGIFVSNTALIFGLVGLYKIAKKEMGERVAKLTLILLLVFPTSFYFGATYTESLFLALTTWSIYFSRNRSWFLASLLACFASATRIIGIILLPVILIEYFDLRFKWKMPVLKFKKDIFWMLLCPLGMLVYMYFLWIRTGDPLNFFNTITIFGAQRSSTLVLLPQVFYRYIFKILPNLNYAVLPVFFPAILELATGIVFTILSVVAFLKLRLSYAVFLALGFLIPTFSGSFSSLPRYVVVLFPAFMLIAGYLVNRKFLSFAITIISFILLIISFSLFVRGYWIS